jgi:hypothetical protein
VSRLAQQHSGEQYVYCCLLLAVAALDDKMIDEGEHTVAVRPSDRSDPFCELASDSIRAYFTPFFYATSIDRLIDHLSL